MTKILRLILLLGCLWMVAADAGELAAVFQNPPAAARPWVYWYWFHGLVSREGVTADLEAMKRASIGGAYLMPIQDVTNEPAFAAPVRQLSPEYWEMVRHAFREADRLGLKLAMHDCDGFATAGGPWITSDLAMQRVVWSETQVEGGTNGGLQLAQPPTRENFYRDIAVLAFPTPEGEEQNTRTIVPIVTTSIPGMDASRLVVAENTNRVSSEKSCWIQYEFDEPYTWRSVVIRPDGNNYQSLRLEVQVSDDGTNFQPGERLVPPRHGWQDGDAAYTFAIKPTTARFFRFVYDPAGSEPGSEDLDSAKWKQVLKLRGIELSGATRIPDYEGKSGVVWRRSSRAGKELISDQQYVPLQQITNLTRLRGADGMLNWTPPAGRWTILRIGYTPTGHRNETGGGGQGLECDKFNAAAARVQFNGWFGETIRQVGPELAGRVLKVFHVDSWEAGSQNWSPVFRDEFVRRRGYDPTPYLPVFAGIPVAGADVSERFLSDVRQTISDLTTENFFGTMAKLAHQHGCEFSAEATAPTMMGDGMRHFSAVDVPMGEFWLRSPTHDKPNDIQDAVSGAHVYGRNLVQAEAFTELRLQWDEYPEMLKVLGDHNFCLGINRFVLHVFMQNPWLDRAPGVSLNGVGTFFQRDQTWWELAGAWVDYLRRCQAMLQQGHPVADVVYFTGEELPSRAVLPERRSPPLPDGYAADSINRDALLRLAAVKHGRIILPGGASYAVLVLPEASTMTPEVATKIQKLAEQGATIYGSPPKRSPSLAEFPACDAKVRKIAADVWGRGRVVTNGSLAEVLQCKGVPPDFLAPWEIEWTHRLVGDAEVYFVSNQRDEARDVDVSIRASGRSAEWWDPVTGERSALRMTESGGRKILPIHLPTHGSGFIVFSRGAGAASVAKRPEEFKAVQEIEGAWQVTFENPTQSVSNQPVLFPSLEDWTEREEPAIRYYSGTAIYRKEFQWMAVGRKQRVWLDLGEVANLASVTLNGKSCGTVWTPPYRVEITGALRDGTNALEIKVANTWNNRLVGDRGLPAAQRKTWTNAPDRPENAALLPAGLLGPVRVLTAD